MNFIENKVDELKAELGEIEMKVLTSYTLADAMREGCLITKQEIGGWTNEEDTACALSSAVISARARGFI